jgi:hypothetical protein
VLLLFSLSSRISLLLTISNNTLEHHLHLNFCSLLRISFLPHLLRLPDIRICSKNLPDSSYPVSHLLSTFPTLTFSNFILHSNLFVDHPSTLALAISPHIPDLSPIATPPTATQTTFSKMSGLSDSQNRYLAMAWLCFDVEPKVSTCICFAPIESRMRNSRECRTSQRS